MTEFPMDDVKDLREGGLVNGRYRLMKMKGAGSFGQVWRAQDTVTGEEVALKLYIPLDAKGIEMFKREYLITKKFKHQNLLSSDHFDNWGRRPFLIMQYCDRGSAAALIGKIDEGGLWRFLRDVASGLAYLHARNIVHQDIKPDNILLNEDGEFLITDFGISKQLKATMRAQSTTMNAAGSISYMGPERFASVPQTLPASDVWSLGATIYHLAVGEPPFNGMGGGLMRHGAELPELPPHFSRALNAVMQSCMLLNPEERPTAAYLARQVAPSSAPATPPPFIPKTDDHTVLDTAVRSQMQNSEQLPPPAPPTPPPFHPPVSAAPSGHTPFTRRVGNFFEEIVSGFKDL